MTSRRLHIVIVGGGISGLATAYYLQQQAQASNLPIDYTLVEQANTLGGKAITETTDGFVIEAGPDSFLTQKPAALALCEELGLEDRLIGTNDDRRNVYILYKGKLRRLPDGWRLTVPTQWWPMVTTPLLSPWGKLRAAMDLFIPPNKGNGDESMGDFIKRRMGKEVLDNLAAPIMAGIYIADPYTLSIQSTFPRFPAMEQKYGSLIKGTLAGISQMRAAAAKRQAERPPRPMFMSLKGGVGELIKAVTAQLSGELVTGQAIATLRQSSTAAEGAYQIQLTGGTSIQADAVVLATPAYASAQILQEANPTLATQLDQIRYISSATISLAFRKADVTHPLNGFGFVTPKTEPSRLLACTWTSTKFNHRVPEEHVLLRAFVGGYANESLVQLPDDELLAVVREELAQVMNIQAEPVRNRIFRWQRGTPQYDVGHLERVEAMEEMARTTLPGLYLTGNAYRGVGMPDCIQQARNTVDQIIQQFEATPSTQPTS